MGKISIYFCPSLKKKNGVNENYRFTIGDYRGLGGACFVVMPEGRGATDGAGVAEEELPDRLLLTEKCGQGKGLDNRPEPGDIHNRPIAGRDL